jgi:hypothetical protein
MVMLAIAYFSLLLVSPHADPVTSLRHYFGFPILWFFWWCFALTWSLLLICNPYNFLILECPNTLARIWILYKVCEILRAFFLIILPEFIFMRLSSWNAGDLVMWLPSYAKSYNQNSLNEVCLDFLKRSQI